MLFDQCCVGFGKGSNRDLCATASVLCWIGFHSIGTTSAAHINLSPVHIDDNGLPHAAKWLATDRADFLPGNRHLGELHLAKWDTRDFLKGNAPAGGGYADQLNLQFDLSTRYFGKVDRSGQGSLSIGQ